MYMWKAVVSSTVSWLPCSTALRAMSSKALVYEKLGKPEEVVRLVNDYPIPELNSDDVAVEMMICPVNPADINQIQGIYGIRPPLPAVAGGDGVGVVTAVGNQVTSLQVGDWVVPADHSLGTWRTCLVKNAKQFSKIRNDLPLHTAATLSVNPTTAYRMLKDFVSLKQGDCVIQNGANSGVGQAIIQLAAAWGITSINVIRDRPNFEELKTHLMELGATEVVTEEFCGSRDISSLIEKYGKPSLGLNTVGGRSATNIIRQLAPSGTMVTYGGMSLKPVMVGTGSLIFNDVRVRGYWNSTWIERNSQSEEYAKMLSDLCDLAVKGQLKAKRCEEYSLEDFTVPLSKAMLPYVSAKQLIIMKS